MEVLNPEKRALNAHAGLVRASAHAGLVRASAHAGLVPASAHAGPILPFFIFPGTVLPFCFFFRSTESPGKTRSVFTPPPFHSVNLVHFDLNRESLARLVQGIT